MSTGLECEFHWIESERFGTEWFYLLQDWDCPVQAWDWTEYATAYGGFPTLAKAEEHLRRNHANPGGHSVAQSASQLDTYAPHLQEAFADARKRLAKSNNPRAAFPFLS